MILRSLLIAMLVVGVAACSKKKDNQAGNVDFGGNTSMQVGDGTGMAGGTGGMGGAGGPVAGSAEDFAVNVGDRVFFGYDRYDLTPEARTQLDLQAKWLNQYPNVRITVEGHADERGTREYNIALGERRANVARDHLVSAGVDAGRIQIISYGKERPAVVGDDAQSWAQNRRAVTRVE